MWKNNLLIMENFRQLIVDAILRKRLKNYENAEKEGLRKRKICGYFDGNYCRIYFEEKIVSVWTSIEHKIKPHPVLCYICPYFSVSQEDNISRSSLLDIYSYYIKMRDRIEREIEYVEAKMNNLIYTYPSLKRRKEELIYLLDEVNEKIRITLELIKLSEQVKIDGNI